MARQRALHRVGMLLEEPRRAFDVGEEEGDDPAGQSTHDAPLVANGTGAGSYARRCSRWSIYSRIELTAAAKTTMTSVTDMINSTLCRPMPFISR